MNNQDITSQDTVAEEIIQKPKAPKKRHRFLKGLLIFIITIVVILGALGFFIPGLLWAKDLGVKYSQADYESAIQKIEYIKDPAPTGESADEYVYTYGALKNISTEFTSAEITAFVNTNRPSYYAVKNAQVKINSDGSVEASGSVNVDYVLNEMLSGKYSRSQIMEEIPALGLLPSNVNLYIKGGGSVVNNDASVNVDSIEVQGISIPQKFVNSSEAASTVNGALNKVLSASNTKSGSNIEKLAPQDGKLLIIGEFPSSLERKLK